MKLFEVKAGARVRIRGKSVRYLVQKDLAINVADSVEYEGIVTEYYVELGGHNRRLIINLNIDFWRGLGVWQRDCDCEVIE